MPTERVLVIHQHLKSQRVLNMPCFLVPLNSGTNKEGY